ncbi:MAG: DUF488 domain-containing protein [Armatimonadia bacterium]
MNPIYTLGHSNTPLESLGDLLAANDIALIIDVRSSPYSKYAIHFNRESLQRYLETLGLRYVYLGRELGGHPASPGFYDDEGYVRYDVIASSPESQEGIEKLLKGALHRKLAVLCSEEDPTNCHRRLLIARVLGERGARVLHLRADGRAQSEADLQREEDAQTGGQQSLFDDEEPRPWRSTQSVTRKNPPENSSLS